MGQAFLPAIECRGRQECLPHEGIDSTSPPRSRPNIGRLRGFVFHTHVVPYGRTSRHADRRFAARESALGHRSASLRASGCMGGGAFDASATGGVFDGREGIAAATSRRPAAGELARRRCAIAAEGGESGPISADDIASVRVAMESLYAALGDASRARGQLLAWLATGGSRPSWSCSAAYSWTILLRMTRTWCRPWRRCFKSSGRKPRCCFRGCSMR